jgi:hypothetical protein
MQPSLLDGVAVRVDVIDVYRRLDPPFHPLHGFLHDSLKCRGSPQEPKKHAVSDVHPILCNDAAVLLAVVLYRDIEKTRLHV